MIAMIQGELEAFIITWIGNMWFVKPMQTDNDQLVAGFTVKESITPWELEFGLGLLGCVRHGL